MRRIQLPIFLYALALLFPLATLAGEKEEALWNAAREGDVATVKQLLHEGVDVNAKNRYEATALFFACDKGHTEVVRVLIEAGADLNAKDNFYGATPLTWAVNNEQLGALRLLLENGVEGVGPTLGNAVRSGNMEMLALLLELGKPDAEALSLALDAAQRRQEQAEDEEGMETAAKAVALLQKGGAEPPAAADFEVPAETLSRYAGTYRQAEGAAEMKLQLVDGGLRVDFGGNPLALGALDATTFRPEGIPAIKLVVQLGDDGAVTGVVFHRGTTEMLLDRVAEETEGEED